MKFVTGEALRSIVDRVPWRDIQSTTGLPVLYNDRFPGVALLAAHTLPYMLPLISERALADELHDQPALRETCGFTGAYGDPPPNRGTLWHFRKRHPGFSTALIASLYSLAEAARALGIDLPFVVSQSGPKVFAGSQVKKFRLPTWDATLSYWSLGGARSASGTLQSTVQLAFEASIIGYPIILEGPKPRTDFGLDIGFPLVLDLGSTRRRYVIDRPAWLGGAQRISLEALSLPTASSHYTAVNILVLDDTRRRALLAPRLSGFGKGSFTIPGGKLRPAERIIDGAKRELREEAGLDLGTAIPLSLRYGRKSFDSPWVRSVGLLAGEYTGRVSRRPIEMSQIGPWDWYDLEDLPTPLFGPAEWVISDYFVRAGTGLPWNALEEGQESFLPLWRGITDY
jgi:8-oxo-dGTP diphosphatase